MGLMPISSLERVLRVCSFICLVALALASSCNNPSFDTFNATASVDVPGFIYGNFNASSENNTMTISTAITEQYIPAVNQSSVLQTFWLDSQPEIDTNLTELPYWGCIITLKGFQETSQSARSSILNGCDGVFSNDCFRMIKYYANEAISLKARNPGDIGEACTILADYISNPFPAVCKKSEQWTTSSATPAFGNLDGPGNTCSGSVFNGSAIHGSILTINSDFSKPNNFTNYDQWVRRTTPVIVTAFSKDISQGLWVDTRLVCLKTDTIEQGSRVPTSDASRGQRPFIPLSWILGVTLSLLLS